MNKKYKDEEWLHKQLIDKQRKTEEIAKEFGCTRRNISYWKQKFNIVTNAQTIQNGEKLCCVCMEWKTLDHFWKSSQHATGLSSICKKCGKN